MLACSFLSESSSKLLVTRTGIKAQMSLILGQIRRLILELLALEWRKFHTFEIECLWSQLASLDQILCVASLGWGKGCIRFWGRLTLAYWTQMSDRCPLGYLFLKTSCFKIELCHEKTCLRGCTTRQDSNLPALLQKLASVLKFLAHLYESRGRAIAVTTASVSASASALLKMLKFLKACISWIRGWI